MRSIGPEARRRLILELLDGSTPVRSQHELGARLARRGCRVNQATLSRDLRELGVLKGPDGYRATSTEVPANGQRQTLARLDKACDEWLTRATAAANQVVARTPPGGAQPLAVAFDHAGIPGVLGTIAGDDTVLVICSSARTASSLARKLASSLPSS